MRRDLYRFFFLIAIIHFLQLSGEELFDPIEEGRYLKNIKQITFPSMGFEKSGEAYFSPDGKNIAFQAVPLGQKHYQIYIMNLDENMPRMISTGKGACTCAYFHPNGKKIIFASNHEDPLLNNFETQREAQGYKRDNSNYTWELTPYMNIYEANLDGSDLKALTSGPNYHAECSYSPDGSRIVFASNASGTMNIHTMDADGTHEQQVTHTDFSYNGGPFFSPSGDRIIFRSDRHIPHYLQIYIINADGSEEHQITDNEAVNWAPYWHPNGQTVVFTTSLHGHNHYEIYGINVKTGMSYRITHNTHFDGLPVFDAKGERMMWTSKRGPDNTCQLFIADFILPIGEL